MRRVQSVLLAFTALALGGGAARAATELPGTIAAYTSQNGAVQHVLIADWQGWGCVGHWSRTTGSGTWNLAACIGDWTSGVPSIAAGSVVTGFWSQNDDTDHAFFIGSDGNLWELYANDGQAGDPTKWSFNNLTQLTSTPKPRSQSATWCIDAACSSTVPGITAASSLTSFYDGYGIEHVFFVDSNYALHEVYHANGAWWGGYHGGQVSATMGQGLSSQWDGSVQHVYFTGADGDLHEAYNDGSWHLHDLTKVSVPPLTASQSPFGYLTCQNKGGVQDIYGFASNGLEDVSYSSGQWKGTTYSGGSAFAPWSPSTTNWALPYFFYVGTDQHIYETDAEPGSNHGQTTDLTAAYNYAAAGASSTKLSSLASLLDSNDDLHLFFVDTTGNLREYWAYAGYPVWYQDAISNLSTGYPP